MSAFALSDNRRDELGKVAVLFGGLSSERVVSLKSGNAVLSALLRANVDAFGIDLGGEAGDLNPIEQLQAASFDRAFVILHGVGGEDGTIQAVLEMMGKPYTGSGVAASALGMDKVRCKQLWCGAGLPTPEYCVITSDTDLSSVADQLGWPIFVKPAHEGSSIGIHKVDNLDDLASAYKEASAFDSLVLAEKWMSGSEFTVAVLGQNVLPPIRLETSHAFYDFTAKYESNDTQYRFDNELSVEQSTELQKIVLAAFNTVGCRGWGRVDVMQDEKGNFQLLEVNTAPGMTDHSLVPMAADKVGISYEELVVQLIEQTVDS